MIVWCIVSYQQYFDHRTKTIYAPNNQHILIVSISRIFELFSLFLWWFLKVPLENFSLLWRHRNYKTLISIEQWVFFSVPHILWHWASVYNGHHLGLETFTLVAKRLVAELSLLVLKTKVCRGRDWNTLPDSACVANALSNCATAAVEFEGVSRLIKCLLWKKITSKNV